MNSVQENKNELEAAVRYCESAISRANATIESMEFRQEAASKAWHEQTGREESLQREVAELKVQLGEREDKWDDAMNENRELRMKLEEAKTNMALLTDEVEFYAKKNNELHHKQQKNSPTMPVIPKAVAIAIFREGTLFGVEAACDEIQGESINISENDYVGDFSISFERDIDLDDHIDFDWVRGKIGDYDEDNVTANLEGLCAKNNFECRIHGIDDQKENKND